MGVLRNLAECDIYIFTSRPSVNLLTVLNTVSSGDYGSRGVRIVGKGSQSPSRVEGLMRGMAGWLSEMSYKSLSHIGL